MAPASTPTSRPSPTEANAADPTETGATSGALDGLFASVFGGALGGGTDDGGVAGLGGGDAALKELLPSESDLPDGFEAFGEFTFAAPDGVSETGAMDVAALMAMKGDPASDDPAGFEVLMAMVLRPEDLQDLGEAFDAVRSLDREEMERQFQAGAGGGLGAFEFKRFDVLELDGIGEGGVGFELALDMGGLFSALSGGLAPADTDAPATMAMRVYMFGRGDYAGAVLRLGFTDALGSGDGDLALARIIDQNLSAAP
jgi:hypothetical protein